MASMTFARRWLRQDVPPLTSIRYPSAIAVQVQLSPGVWTTLDDVVADEGMRIKYGITGMGPTDCVASPGTLALALRNDAGNSGATQGWYSPNHASKRTGWDFGIPVRVVFTYAGIDYTRFRGKIRTINPDAGLYGPRRAHVTAYDAMRDLVTADVRALTLQLAQTEAVLVDAILDAVATDAQPVATDIDAGVDTFAVAFDDLGGGVKAITALRDVLQSAFALGFVTGGGTFTTRSRHSRTTTASAATFTSQHGLSVPSSADQCFNLVRIIIRPKVVDAAATAELYTMPTGNSIPIAAGETIVVWCDYTDPNDRQTTIGGANVVEALVGGTHFGAFANADGTGTNLTGSITADIDPFGSTAKYTLTLGGATSGFITLLKVIGKAIRDPGPQTFEQSSAQAFGQNAITIDLRYQGSADIARSAATYIETQYRTLANQIEALEFLANWSDDYMVQALTREPGDIITITEAVTGVTLVEAVIHSVELEITKGLIVRCRWGLAPASPWRFWQLGTVGASELGVSTTLAF